ncbi:AAA family ATPase [Brevundimonas sp. 2R-24]|uniref:AAA family ATPase n=1 Tax=Peiella sedimenti TaxID=3061083 RepID=A0ABT8SQK6_9CAUL|nr:AAA family ATPase [Caulobacteraceae bacterium XZ-24]
MQHLLIGIVGGSGSGKTTLARRLAARLGSRAAVLGEDAYYFDLPEGVDPAHWDFDDVKTRDHARLAADLGRLKAGETIQAPRYDFVHHRRLPWSDEIAPAEVIIVEGLHLLCTPEVADLFDLRVFVDAPADIRFIRRLLRDQAERGRSVQSVTEQYLETVRPAYLRQIEPCRNLTDVVIHDKGNSVRFPDPAHVDALLAAVLAHPLVAGKVGLD